MSAPTIHRRLREQFALYKRDGFEVESIEPRNGSHFKVVFKGIDRAFFLTKSETDPRAYKNNLAELRRAIKTTKGAAR
jgi:hypothetical protein